MEAKWFIECLKVIDGNRTYRMNLPKPTTLDTTNIYNKTTTCIRSIYQYINYTNNSIALVVEMKVIYQVFVDFTTNFPTFEKTILQVLGVVTLGVPPKTWVGWILPENQAINRLANSVFFVFGILDSKDVVKKLAGEGVTGLGGVDTIGSPNMRIVMGPKYYALRR